MVHSENVRFARDQMLGRLRQPLPLRDMEMSVTSDLIKQVTGFYLHYIQHGNAGAELIWTIRVFSTLSPYCTSNQILVHFANVFKPYRNWTFGHGYRERDGLRVAPAIAADVVLPDNEHINLQAFGDSDPPRSVWDDYDKYQAQSS